VKTRIAPAVLGSLTLVVLAGFAVWAAVALHDSGLDPHWSAVGTAALFAALFCLLAIYKLWRVARSGGTWWKVSWWVVLGVLSLVALDLVAFATRLGG
jgi:undecaprenyl pyrophosphate phosphatase UppP